MHIEQLGPYRIGRKLGKGGMGSVFEAIDEKTGQRVAVKALTPQLAMAEGFRERFESEIESLKKLQHEGIVRLLGYGEHEGILFYSMELVEGPSLEQEINSGRRFDWSETLTLAIQTCRALKHAHDHGVIHRDIKPANLLLTPDERLKIADFGIARLFGSTQLTTAGGVLGTADYMSPEQADGRAVTEKCDQYSLGSVMYALLTGRPPFRAKTMPEMLQMQRFAEPEPVRRYAPQTPEQLDRLIGQLLSKEPAERFPNVLVLGRHMEAMRRALSRPAKQEQPAEAADADSPSRLDSTALFNADATLAPEDLAVTPSETTDSGVYDAPTLADDGQLAPEEPSLPTARGAAAMTAAATRPTMAAPRESRFTTVDDETQRRRLHEQRAQRWLLAMQLAGIAAALAALGWLGWRLTRPATAEALYIAITEQVETNAADLRPAASEIKEFIERFPDDDRLSEIKGYAEELEMQRLERQLSLRRKIRGDSAAHPLLTGYADARAIEETQPARAAAMLEDLLTLYMPAGVRAPGLGQEEEYCLTLAERRLKTLRASLGAQAEFQLPNLRERFVEARRLEEADPALAAKMYRAIIDLHAPMPWAAEIVADAAARLKLLQEK